MKVVVCCIVCTVVLYVYCSYCMFIVLIACFLLLLLVCYYFVLPFLFYSFPREKITTIRQEGVECLERLSNDFELNLLLR